MLKHAPFEVELSLLQVIPYLDGLTMVYDLARKAGLEVQDKIHERKFRAPKLEKSALKSIFFSKFKIIRFKQFIFSFCLDYQKFDFVLGLRSSSFSFAVRTLWSRQHSR